MTKPHSPSTLVALANITTLPQVRASLDPKKVALMRASVAESGLFYPVCLRKLEDGSFAVLDGHYRLAGVTELGWTEVPAIIDDAPRSDAEVTCVQLATAQCRFGLNPMEEARGYDKYLRASGATAAKLATSMGKSEAHISRARALVGIKDELQEFVACGRLGPSLALDLDRVQDPALYASLLGHARNGTLTRQQLSKLRKPPRKARGSSKAAPRLTMPLGSGCSLSLNGTTRSITQIVDLLNDLVDRVRRARSAAQDDLGAFMTIIAQGSGP